MIDDLSRLREPYYKNAKKRQKTPKNAKIYIRDICNLNCNKNSNYNTHLLTAKHKMITNDNK